MSLGDLPPRQKMINIMYLVLLALLAMNVSKEILHSFVIINEGLEETTGHFEHKINDTYAKFNKMAATDAAKVGPFLAKAEQVQKHADEIDEILEHVKIEIISRADQITIEEAKERSLEHVENKDNQEWGTYILVGTGKDQMWKEGTPEWEYSALRLKGLIGDFNKEVQEVLNLEEEQAEDVSIPLHPTMMHDVEEPWELANFYHLPLAAIITNLSRFQADIRNIEAEVLRRLMNEVSADDFKFDTLAPKVIPQYGTYITVGDSFKADVIVAAYSTTQDPSLHIAPSVTDGQMEGYDSLKVSLANPDSSSVTIKNGIATYSFVPTSAGDYEWGGLIRIRGPKGDWKPYPFTHKFKAAKPSLVVAPTKMNVFYKGLANPVEISAAGMSPADLSLSVSGCSVKTVSKAEGKYEVIPPDNMKGKEVNVTVRATGPNSPNFKPIKYRIKPVPPPTPEVLGKRGSFKMTKAEARSIEFITAKLDNFLFDLKFRVKEFKVTVQAGSKSKTYPIKGNRMTAEIKNIVKTMSPSQHIIIKDIVAQRSDGGNRLPLDGNLIIEIK